MRAPLSPLLRALMLRLARFGLVGALNSCIAYATFSGLLLVEVHFAVATFAGSVLSMLLGFKLHGSWVFRRDSKGLFLRYVALFIALYLLSVGVQALAQVYMNPYWAGALAAALVWPLSFLLNGRLVFGVDHRTLEPGEPRA